MSAASCREPWAGNADDRAAALSALQRPMGLDAAVLFDAMKHWWLGRADSFVWAQPWLNMCMRVVSCVDDAWGPSSTRSEVHALQRRLLLQHVSEREWNPTIKCIAACFVHDALGRMTHSDWAPPDESSHEALDASVRVLTSCLCQDDLTEFVLRGLPEEGSPEFVEFASVLALGCSPVTRLAFLNTLDWVALTLRVFFALATARVGEDGQGAYVPEACRTCWATPTVFDAKAVMEMWHCSPSGIVYHLQQQVRDFDVTDCPSCGVVEACTCLCDPHHDHHVATSSMSWACGAQVCLTVIACLASVPTWELPVHALLAIVTRLDSHFQAACAARMLRHTAHDSMYAPVMNNFITATFAKVTEKTWPMWTLAFAFLSPACESELVTRKLTVLLLLRDAGSPSHSNLVAGIHQRGACLRALGRHAGLLSTKAGCERVADVLNVMLLRLKGVAQDLQQEGLCVVLTWQDMFHAMAVWLPHEVFVDVVVQLVELLHTSMVLCVWASSCMTESADSCAMTSLLTCAHSLLCVSGSFIHVHHGRCDTALAACATAMDCLCVAAGRGGSGPSGPLLRVCLEVAIALHAAAETRVSTSLMQPMLRLCASVWEAGEEAVLQLALWCLLPTDVGRVDTEILVRVCDLVACVLGKPDTRPRMLGSCAAWLTHLAEVMGVDGLVDICVGKAVALRDPSWAEDLYYLVPVMELTARRNAVEALEFALWVLDTVPLNSAAAVAGHSRGIVCSSVMAMECIVFCKSMRELQPLARLLNFVARLEEQGHSIEVSRVLWNTCNAQGLLKRAFGKQVHQWVLRTKGALVPTVENFCLVTRALRFFLLEWLDLLESSPCRVLMDLAGSMAPQMWSTDPGTVLNLYDLLHLLLFATDVMGMEKLNLQVLDQRTFKKAVEKVYEALTPWHNQATKEWSDMRSAWCIAVARGLCHHCNVKSSLL